MVEKIKGVSTKVSRSFFNNIFEKERRKMERQMGIRLSQIKFTEIVNNRGGKIVFPKKDKKFAPKEFKKFIR